MLKALILFMLLLPAGNYAAGPAVWSVNTKAEIMKGDARGVTVESDGTIRLAPALKRIFRTEQPYIWSMAAAPDGTVYLGTGTDGRIFRVDATGNGSVFADTSELNVSALALSPSGDLFAGTSPDGKVYKIGRGGEVTPYFEPKEKYIWSLAAMPDGSIAVGTGETGRIYRIRSAGADPSASLVFDSKETHILTLAAGRSGELYAGTDPGGIVLRIGADNKAFAVLDAPLREIHQLRVAPDGILFVLAVAESAGAAPSAPAQAQPTAAAGPPAPTPAAAEPPPRSRYDLSGARSAVYRIAPDGTSAVIWSSPSVTGFSIYAHQTGGGALIGTSDKGRVYNASVDARETLVLQSDAGQVAVIASAGDRLFAASSNPGDLYRIGSESNAEGSYISSVLDAKAAASWGRIWWRSAGTVSIETRSGNTEQPDETWSGWSAAGAGGSGMVASPAARFLQWRAVMKAGPTAPELSEVNVSYLPQNIRPEVLSLTILPTNVGLVPNPPVQLDPNIELSGLDPSAFGIVAAPVPPRRVYQRAARSFQWTAEDRNGDKLVYDVFFKEARDAEYKPLKRGISETFITVDGQSLADGHYTVKIVARDTPDNTAKLALAGDLISEPFEIDNTQPEVGVVGAPQVSGTSARVQFAAADKSSYIVRAEYSVDGGEWQQVAADDGISDSPRESYTVNIAALGGERNVTLRVFDASGNVGNARAVIR